MSPLLLTTLTFLAGWFAGYLSDAYLSRVAAARSLIALEMHYRRTVTMPRPTRHQRLQEELADATQSRNYHEARLQDPALAAPDWHHHRAEWLYWKREIARLEEDLNAHVG